MARRRPTTDSFVSDDSPLDLLDQQSLAPAAVAEEPPPAEPEQLKFYLAKLPIGAFRERQCRPSHLDLRLGPQHGRALQRLLNGLDLADVRMPNGRKPETFADVVRWLLEQLPS